MTTVQIDVREERLSDDWGWVAQSDDWPGLRGEGRSLGEAVDNLMEQMKAERDGCLEGVAIGVRFDP